MVILGLCALLVLVIVTGLLLHHKKNERVMRDRRDIRVPLVVKCPNGNTVNVFIVSDDDPILRGHGFLHVQVMLNTDNDEEVDPAADRVWKVLCKELANKPGSGTDTCFDDRSVIMTNGGTTLVDIVDALKKSGFSVQSCIV
jgi:hypothetical protein